MISSSVKFQLRNARRIAQRTSPRRIGGCRGGGRSASSSCIRCSSWRSTTESWRAAASLPGTGGGASGGAVCSRLSRRANVNSMSIVSLSERFALGLGDRRRQDAHEHAHRVHVRHARDRAAGRRACSRRGGGRGARRAACPPAARASSSSARCSTIRAPSCSGFIVSFTTILSTEKTSSGRGPTWRGSAAAPARRATRRARGGRPSCSGCRGAGSAAGRRGTRGTRPTPSSLGSGFSGVGSPRHPQLR